MPDTFKVLVAESQRYRVILGKLLARDPKLRSLNLKIEVVEATDGAEALDRFREHRPNLVVQELLLPKVSGFELVRQIRALPEGLDVPILVITALTQDMTTLNLLGRSYGVHHMSKPFAPWDFAAQIHRIITASRAADRPAPAPTTPRPHRITPPEGPLRSTPSLIDVDFGGLEKTPAVDLSAIEVERTGAGGAGEAPARPAARTKPLRSSKGSLAEASLPLLLLDALEEGLSGTLTLRQAKMLKVIYLLQGYPVFAQSNLRRETMGQMLVQRGRLTAEQNNQALAVARERDVPYGNALRLLGLMATDEFNHEILINVRLKIEGSLLWRTGTWVFREDPAVGDKVPRCVVDPVKLVLGGLKAQVNVEESVQRIAGRENHRFSVLPRFERYRSQFLATFGNALVEAARPARTLNEMLQAMGSNPWDAVLQADILLLTGMAMLHETDDELQNELVQSGEFADAARMQFRPDESMH